MWQGTALLEAYTWQPQLLFSPPGRDRDGRRDGSAAGGQRGTQTGR